LAHSRFAIAATLAFASAIAACDRGGAREKKPAQAASRVATPPRTRDTSEAAGEVANEVASNAVAEPEVRERWITDANVLSLMSGMNARQIAAADVELSTWHSDTVRAFAASMAREHAELQHAVDSITAHLNLTPVTPALAKPWLSTMQTQIDSIRRASGDALDRAYVRQQVNSHQLMGDYIKQLAVAAERPELRAFLETTAGRVASQLQRARSLQTVLAAADSAAARRAASRKRAPMGP